MRKMPNVCLIFPAQTVIQYVAHARFHTCLYLYLWRESEYGEIKMWSNESEDNVEKLKTKKQTKTI